MKKSITTLLLTITFVSCDYFNDTRVCNHTGQEITLKLKFDPDFVKNWGLEPKKFTQTFHNGNDNLILLNFDTINFSSTYLIKSDSCGQIEGGNNRRPHFGFFKEMEIITKSDTLRLKTKNEMRKAFDADREDPKYYFDLIIK